MTSTGIGAMRSATQCDSYWRQRQMTDAIILSMIFLFVIGFVVTWFSLSVVFSE